MTNLFRFPGSEGQTGLTLGKSLWCGAVYGRISGVFRADRAKFLLRPGGALENTLDGAGRKEPGSGVLRRPAQVIRDLVYECLVCDTSVRRIDDDLDRARTAAADPGWRAVAA
jgi:hypothetical protein